VLLIKSYSFIKQFRELSVSMIMKKVISISLVIMMIAAMLHLSVAIHYCSGKIAASKVSLTGRLANCGMEGSEKELLLPGISFSKHCCDDLISTCGTDCNFVPSFSFIPESYNYNFQVLAVLAGFTNNSFPNLISLYTNVNPPGVVMSTNVDLSDICVFRT
jgi:hypothetical protein